MLEDNVTPLQPLPIRKRVKRFIRKRRTETTTFLKKPMYELNVGDTLILHGGTVAVTMLVSMVVTITTQICVAMIQNRNLEA